MGANYASVALCTHGQGTYEITGKVMVKLRKSRFFSQYSNRFLPAHQLQFDID